LIDSLRPLGSAHDPGPGPAQWRPDRLFSGQTERTAGAAPRYGTRAESIFL